MAGEPCSSLPRSTNYLIWIMDISALLTRVSPDKPCGNDFETDNSLGVEMDALETLVAGTIADDGSTIPPRWPDVKKKAFALAKKGKHLRIATIIAEYGLMAEGLMGFGEGIKLILNWCSEYWETIQPVDRITVIEVIRAPRFLPKIERLAITRSRSGEFSFQDFRNARGAITKARAEIMRATGKAGSPKVEIHSAKDAAAQVNEASGQIRAAVSEGNEIEKEGDIQAALNWALLVFGAFGDTSREVHQANIDCMNSMLENIEALENLFREQADRLESGSDDKSFRAERLSMEPLRELITGMRDALLVFTQDLLGQSVGSSSSEGNADAESISGAGVAGHILTGKGQSRESIIAMLDQAINFFEVTEPSSPVPLLLKRAKRCIGKNFMELIDELAPDKIQAELVLKPYTDQQAIDNT